MDYLNQPRTDIPPFKSFADAIDKVTTAIAQILSDMEAERTALEQRREKTQAMMQELLTGRTQLI
jgi:type I restriction enzyme S subunit